MTITYIFENAIYINMTNKCTNKCEFCIRNNTETVGDSDSLWLDREPTVKEIIADIEKRDVEKYREIVFCGFGEPIIRLYDLLEVAKYIKAHYSIPVRINTNGHGNLIFNEDITPQFKSLIDSVSISLNASNAEDYVKVCKPKYGENSFYAIVNFAKRCKKYVPTVILSVVDTMPKDEIDRCKEIASEVGVTLRVREYIE